MSLRPKPWRDLTLVVKGAGEMATGVAHRLCRSGFRLCLTEIPEPLAVRRGVAFSEAVFCREKQVEGLTARRAEGEEEVRRAWERGQIPLVVDPECEILRVLKPHVLIDAILAKKNTGTRIQDAPLVIGLGPGFWAGRDVHLVVETNRGHSLGRVIEAGAAEPDTGVPGEIAGYSLERVLRAPASGIFSGEKKIGDPVRAGERVGEVGGIPVVAGVGGVLRGILGHGRTVRQGMKLGDVDPRGVRDHCFTLSDKARSIGGGVLEAILMRYESL